MLEKSCRQDTGIPCSTYSSQCRQISLHTYLVMILYCRRGNKMGDTGNTMDVAILLLYLNDIIVVLANSA